MEGARLTSPSHPTPAEIRRVAVETPERLAELFPGAPAQLLQALREGEERLRITEEALARSESRERERSGELAALFDAVPTPVFIAHDPACLHITGNRAADELLRNPRGGEASLGAPTELRPRHFKAVKDGRELQIEELPAQQAAAGIPVKDFEFTLVFEDGMTSEVIGYGSPLLDEAGRSRGSVIVLVDITERKRAAAALEEAYQQVRELAARLQSIREEERARISREIHDELTQNLTAVRFGLVALGRQLDPAPSSLRYSLEETVSLVEGTLGTVRRIASDLRPAVLDALGLGAALAWQAEEFQRRLGIRCSVELDTDLPKSDRDRSTAFFRIFQEALSNVAQHAAATEVRARLWKEEGNLCMEVSDNGRGLPAADHPGRKSLGLLGMRERAAAVAGTVEVSGESGRGTNVVVLIPLARRKGGRKKAQR